MASGSINTNVESTSASSLDPKQRLKRESRHDRRMQLIGLAFCSPWILGLLLFVSYPIIMSIYYSFTSYSILNPGDWVGFENYRVLFNDQIFYRSIYNTLYFTFLFVPLSIAVGVGIAILLNMRIRGQGIYRTMFFMPTLVPPVAVVIIWMFLLNPQFGLVNHWLESIGIAGPGWLGSEKWSKPSLILMSMWGLGQAIIIYLAGLQDISQEYYEAAEVDGANTFQRLRHITLPLLTPVIFFNLIMGTIGALQQFVMPFILTNGQGTPAGSMMFYVMYLYTNGFGYLKMGYASAMAWILFLIVVALTALIFYTQKRWVFYQGK